MEGHHSGLHSECEIRAEEEQVLGPGADGRRNRDEIEASIDQAESVEDRDQENEADVRGREIHPTGFPRLLVLVLGRNE